MVKRYAEDYAFNSIRRLTATIAATTERQFIAAANAAFMQVASGASDYDSAMKRACHELASQGVYTVSYIESGRQVTHSIETAIRANIITGINQSAAQQTEINCQYLGCDLVETSAHIGARNKDGPNEWSNHEEWQGSVFHLGSGREYMDGNGRRQFAPSFKASCGPGYADGICGINCRHSYYPYFEGTRQTFGMIDDEPIDIDGKKISRYDAEQKLRYYERGVRRWKREADMLASIGEDNTRARMKIAEWQGKAKAWCEKTGLRRDYAREAIGTSSGRQPKGVSVSVTGYADNLQKAQTIKRLDNARNKVIAKVTQGKPMNFRQADGGAPNPNYKKGGSYRKNCQSCLVAYEMRRRGFDVETLPNYKGSMADVLSYNTRLAWVDRNTNKNPDYILPSQRTTRKVFEWLKSDSVLKENRYTIEFVWKGERVGHIVHLWKNKSGKLSIYDPQTGVNTYNENKVLEYLKETKPSTIKLLNVQNCDINMNVANKILQERK